MSRPVAVLVTLALLGSAVLAKVNILGFWWENPLPHQEVPKGLRSLRAADCGVCHAEIYREWQLSAHAHALRDLQFQAEMTKSPETRWLCLNCHTPLENQLPIIAVGVRNQSTHEPILRKNAKYNAALEDEGVTCAVCHVRDGVILGPYGDSKAPHPVRKEPKLLTSQTCAACHQATAAYTDTLVCNLDTAGEWRSGPYATKGQECSHCHMPAAERPIAAGRPARHARRHYFIGSMIPKEFDGAPSNKPVNPGNLYRSGLAVKVVKVTGRGRETEVELQLRNAYAGHKLPTGDPERFIRVDLALLSAGRIVGRQSLRIGQVWEWWPKARKISDNRLGPFEERLEKVRFPGAAKRPLALEITVTNVRISDEAARYHNLLGRYPTHAEVQKFRLKL
jgi:hypothetical protein